eukprot:Sdes_comp19003_c0_seq1m9546
MTKSVVEISKNIRQNVNPTEMFELITELGDGSFGKVYKARERKTARLAAVKLVQMEGDEELEDLQIEIDILKECSHRDVVELYDAFLFEESIWLVIEFCDGGAMDDIYAELEMPLSEAQIQCVMKQMLEALSYIHQRKIVHRDIKAGNILLTSAGIAKLADFGVSAKNKSTLQKRDTFIGTPYWMAPEVIRCETLIDQPYDFKCDIWSLGITAIELAEMNPPFHEMHPMRVLFKIPKSNAPTLSEKSLWSLDFHSFLQSCLVKDPHRRLSSQELLLHTFVKNIASFDPLKELYLQYRAPVMEEIEKEEDDDEGESEKGSSCCGSSTLFDKDSAHTIAQTTTAAATAIGTNTRGPPSSRDSHPHHPHQHQLAYFEKKNLLLRGEISFTDDEKDTDTDTFEGTPDGSPRIHSEERYGLMMGQQQSGVGGGEREWDGFLADEMEGKFCDSFSSQCGIILSELNSLGDSSLMESKQQHQQKAGRDEKVKQEGEEEEGVAGNDCREISTSKTCLRGGGEGEENRYMTIVRTRTFQRDGRIFTTKTRKLIETAGKDVHEMAQL